MLYISFNKCCSLANEGLVNLMGMPSLHPLQAVNLVHQHQCTRCFPTTLWASSLHWLKLCLCWFCISFIQLTFAAYVLSSDWAKLHKKQFDQMDSLDVYMEKKTRRALSLFSPNHANGSTGKERRSAQQVLLMNTSNALAF